MTNLDSLFKSRDITLPTKVCPVKAMVFPVVMYGCERVGHLNKTSGQNSAYRGLGSIDFYAAARSVLIVGQLKDQPNVRVIVHEKSSLSPNGD